MAANAIQPRRFSLGDNLPSAAAESAKEERPQAKFWLNVGYEVAVKDADGVEGTRFISLPVGLPLDTQQHRATRGTGEVAQIISAGNDLLDELIKAAQAIPAGETKLVNLQIQIRHVQEASAIPAGTNAFSPSAVGLNLLG